MKIAILVCLLVAHAGAAPRYARSTRLDRTLSEHVRAAEQAWTTAEGERDAVKQPGLWEQAAAAFREVDGDAVDPKVKRDAAYAAVLAWKNALAIDVNIKLSSETPASSAEVPVPQPLPARELELVATVQRYATYAGVNDPELPGVLFMEAMIYLRFDQLETAIPKLQIIVERYPQDALALYAATHVLDAYNRLHRYDELVAYAAKLANETKLMRDHADLATLVANVLRLAKRKHVEELEATARDAHDLDKYVAVGTAYLELYNADTKSPQGDELLYNAGVAFETGHSATAAIQAFETLQRHYPNSKLAARALASVGNIYSDLAMFAEAADKLEQYAKKYAAEKDAFGALSDAVLFRRVLGDRDKAIADAEYLVRTFGAKHPREVADVVWSLTALFDAEPDRAIAQLRTYLHRFGAKGDAGRVVIAHAKIGLLLWKKSCSLPGVDGLCVKEHERAARTCGTGTARTSTVSARDPRKRAEALAELMAAIVEYERTQRIDDWSARYFYAQSKLAIADDELETFLALAVPRGSSFDPTNRAASMKRFSAWLEQKQRLGGNATRSYEAVLSIKDAAGSITATARLGVLPQSFASSLVTAEIPLDVRTGARATDQIKAYCDSMMDVAAPFEARAVEAFAVCLAKSTELSWFSDSSVVCEHGLLALKPSEFPRASELRAAPLFVSPVIAVEALP